jgi:hypothetical protein
MREYLIADIASSEERFKISPRRRWLASSLLDDRFMTMGRPAV